MDLNQEKQLIQRAKKDPQVFGQIYDEYYPKILGYTLKSTADPHVAAEITSETFYKALRKLWQFRFRNISFSSWLYKIATNEIRQYFRRRKTFSLDALAEIGFDVQVRTNIETEFMEAQETLDRHRNFLEIQKQIAHLNTKYREVIVLRFFEGKQIAEIAEILGRSEGTVKSQLHRGVENLRKLMQPSRDFRIIESERSRQLTENIQNYDS